MTETSVDLITAFSIALLQFQPRFKPLPFPERLLCFININKQGIKIGYYLLSKMPSEEVRHINNKPEVDPQQVITEKSPWFRGISA